MKYQENILRLERYYKRCAIAIGIVICLLLSNVNFSMMLTYAKLDSQFTVKIGDNVTAVIEDGVLTLSGDGTTDNFSAETAPFLDYASEIHTLIIEEGITSIGSYLFYGLGNLTGELVLPSSINHFGDYAFSGDSQQNAAHFSLIRNVFSSNEIIQQTSVQSPEITPEPETDMSENNPSDVDQPVENESESSDLPVSGPSEDEPVSTEPIPDNSAADETQAMGNKEQNKSTDSELGDPSLLAVIGSRSLTFAKSLMEIVLNETEGEDQMADEPEESLSFDNIDDSQNSSLSESQDSDRISDDNESNINPDEDAGNASSNEEVPPVNDSVNEDAGTQSPEFNVETINQQSITDPSTLFYGGQSGIVICSDQNESFIQAAEMAGYERAEGIVNAVIDENLDMTLPLMNGMITLPQQIYAKPDPYADDLFFTGKFKGWSLTKDTDSASVYSAQDSLEAVEDSQIQLFSIWEKEARFKLRVNAVRKDDIAVYSLNEETSYGFFNGFEGYEYLYQWQIADKTSDEKNRIWSNISGADGAVYERQVEADDVSKLFRCAVSVVKQIDLYAENESVMLYSEPIAAAVEVKTVYVDSVDGNDSTGAVNNSDKPYKTLTKAAGELTAADEGGTAESNQLILLNDYSLESSLNSKFLNVPVTISAKDNTVKLSGYGSDSELNQISLQQNIVFYNLTLDKIGHIYGNGNDITFDDNVITVGGTYLYGAGNNLLGERVGNITVKSGTFSRIAAYARSTPSQIDASGKKSTITIAGGNISVLLSGSANGSVANADVTINISGGYVGGLLGGCQGFNNNKADYSGQTVINISGGKVGTLYGAGTGRNVSVPTFKGILEINVTGGTLGDIYSAGTLAQVISDPAKSSEIKINVSGGSVNNIYAAGIGGDVNHYKYNDEYISNPEELGCLTGNAIITISGTATVSNIYGSGKGFASYEGNNKDDAEKEGYQKIIEGAKKNAYVKGAVEINIEGGTITGDIYGSGEGLNKEGYEQSARIAVDSSVKININDGTIKGNVYGGGKYANNEGIVSITLNNGTVENNIYGGGNQGKLLKMSEVNINGGSVLGSVYGGALGVKDKYQMDEGSTVNMTDGIIYGNLYGGSQNSDDGTAGNKADLIFVNLVGGTIKGNVFGGSYKGYVHGSTHVHVGEGALAKCAFYSTHTGEMPVLAGKTLKLEGSVYAGGDFGGDTINYDNITISGYSHLYIDGTGYFDNSEKTMEISGGVFGSGASCDAGGVRLITFDHFGNPAIDSNGDILDSASVLTAIQRADQVRLINSHLRLSGQSDVANENQTAPYSLNQIGNLGLKEELKDNIYGNSLVLMNNSSLILDAAAIEIANLKSMTVDSIIADADTKNMILLNSGTVFRIAYTDKTSKSTVYGHLYGKTYLLAGNMAEAYAYAANNTELINGNFVDIDGIDLSYEELTDYRYWKIKGDETSVVWRDTVLTAQNVSSSDGYAVAQGSVELSPVTADTNYKISKITIPVGMELVETAKNKFGDWKLAGKLEGDPTAEQLAAQLARIDDEPLSVFGLYIGMGEGFSEAAQQTGNVISNESAKYDSANSIIGNEIPARAVNAGDIPKVIFYLTYKSDEITISKDVGTVIIEVEQYENGILRDIIKMNVQIVTKASAMSANQTLDLYASQDGSYTGELIIPAGNTMNLDLKAVNMSNGSNLVNCENIKNPQDFALTIQPINSSGWQNIYLTEPYDINNYSTGTAIHLGTTDSRFEASLSIILYNHAAFSSKEDDLVTLTLTDGSKSYNVNLKIHWSKSVVEKTELYPGKQYNDVQTGQPAEITSQGAVTAVFSFNDRADITTLWLDRNKMPKGTKITLVGYNNNFYTYTVPEEGAADKIMLSEFSKMWYPAVKLEGTVEKNQQLKLIIDFDNTNLTNGSYKILLNNAYGAAPAEQTFTVKDAKSPKLIMNAGEKEGEYKIQLSDLTDTRLIDGAGMVLSLESSNIPQWVEFSYLKQSYAPINGKLYLPKLSGAEPIIMNTANAKDFDGSQTFKADVYGAGLNAGSDSVTSLTYSIRLASVPVYALNVKLDESQGRAVKAGDTLKFNLTYTMQNVSQANIEINVLQKNGAAYVSAPILNAEDINITTSGNRVISITVPNDIPAGTYRIVFTLGDQKVPYNIIVQ